MRRRHLFLLFQCLFAFTLSIFCPALHFEQANAEDSRTLIGTYYMVEPQSATRKQYILNSSTYLGNERESSVIQLPSNSLTECNRNAYAGGGLTFVDYFGISYNV